MEERGRGRSQDVDDARSRQDESVRSAKSKTGGIRTWCRADVERMSEVQSRNCTDSARDAREDE